MINVSFVPAWMPMPISSVGVPLSPWSGGTLGWVMNVRRP